MEAEAVPTAITETAVEAKETAIVEDVSNADSTTKNVKTLVTKGHASAPMSQPTPVTESGERHVPVAMAHDKRELIPDSGLRAGSIKPAGRASSAMTKTLSAD